MDPQPLGSRRNGEFPVMRRERQIVELVAYEQGAREMDRIERADDRRERFRGPLEDRRVERHQREAFDRLEDRGSAIRDVIIIEPEAKPCTVDRA